MHLYMALSLLLSVPEGVAKSTFITLHKSFMIATWPRSVSWPLSALNRGVTQQIYPLRHTEDVSAVVSRNRQVCCVTQQTCLLCHTADIPCHMSAVSHSRHVANQALHTHQASLRIIDAVPDNRNLDSQPDPTTSPHLAPYFQTRPDYEVTCFFIV